MRALEIVFRILWSVALGGLIYGSTIWLLRVELSGDIERMEPGKAWLLGGLAWINAVVILVIGGMDGRLPEENRLVILGVQEILCSLLAGGLLAAACMDAVHSYVYNCMVVVPAMDRNTAGASGVGSLYGGWSVQDY